MASGLTGVVLMSFGTAESVQDVPAYLSRIRGGSVPPESLVAEFQRRYRAVGGSPLTRITGLQAQALEAELNRRGAGAFRVVIGMRHAPPFIAAALAALVAKGATRIVALIMAPQHSPTIMAGYHRAISDARPSLPSETEVLVPGAWHGSPGFLAALSSKLQAALASLPGEERRTVPVLFTAHSLPRVIVEKEPEYLDMLRETARGVASATALPEEQWQFAYQSAGHTPQEWLRPDIEDLFPGLLAAGHRTAIIAPVQFLADHMEVLYDIDIEARQQAKAVGIDLRRTEMLNTTPEFIDAMAEVVLKQLG